MKGYELTLAIPDSSCHDAKQGPELTSSGIHRNLFDEFFEYIYAMFSLDNGHSLHFRLEFRISIKTWEYFLDMCYDILKDWRPSPRKCDHFIPLSN